ncbi:MAG: hypothetical protein RLZZ387_3816 [Chloroflexota bacterium]|jgi:hypothetical protein
MGFEALTRVFEYAPHDGKPFIVLVALAERANPAGVCWPGTASLALYCRVKHVRNLRQYLRALEETGDLYTGEGRGRKHKARYLVATAMSADEITQVLSDVEYFDLPIEEAASVAHDMVERQRQAQSEFEDTIPLSTLRENKRRGAGPRSVKKGIAGSSLEKGITRSSLEKGITRSSPTEEKRGSPDPQKEDRVIPQPRGKGDQAIHRKGRFTASGQPKRLSEPPPNHEPTWNHDHDPPPPEAANHVDSGGGGMSETALFLMNEVDVNPRVAAELGDLPLNRVRELVARKRRSGSRSGGIVNALRALQTQLPLSPAQEHEAQQEHSDRSEAALERRARGIAPSDITELEMQYLLLYLEEGASDDEALQRLQAQRDDEPLMSVEEGM